MEDNIFILTLISGALAFIAIVIYIIYYFKRGKDNSKEESEDVLFRYLVREIEGDLGQGKITEASTIYNRLNHVYEYLDKKDKPEAKKTLDRLFNLIKIEKEELK